MELHELVGEHEFDAIDFLNQSDLGPRFDCAQSVRFRLDGVIYLAIEDPEDGHRSCMREIIAVDGGVMRNTFKPVSVVARYKTDRYCEFSEVLEFTDKATGLLILEVGTDNTMDYYPCFVSSFYAENMPK